MRRVITGLILGLGWLILLLFGSYVLFCLVITLAGGAALYEFLGMSSTQTEQKYKLPVLCLGIFPLAAVSLWGNAALTSALQAAFVFLTLLTLRAYPALENSLFFIARSWFGIFYIGFCSAHLILLRSLPGGIRWLLVLTAITVFSDTGAYYVGRTLGRTKLYPALSPGKTRAGAVGGVAAGTVGGIAAAMILFTGMDLTWIALLSLGLSVIGIIGDLVESLVKRVSEVKDSGRILPGHGGLMDRFDSLLLTAPVLYYFLFWAPDLLFP